MIGIQEVRDLALATNVLTLFPEVSADLVNMDSFWRHSVACGVSAHILAREANSERADSIFIAGLLHDIGRLVIYLYLPEASQQVLEETNRNNRYQYEVGREILRYDHGMVGAELLEEWNLPADLVYAVWHHHEPEHDPEVVQMVIIIHLANLLSHSMKLGHSGIEFQPEISEDDWKTVGLTLEDAGGIQAQVGAEYDSKLALFRSI